MADPGTGDRSSVPHRLLIGANSTQLNVRRHRMCELVDLEVTGLKRIRIGRVVLGQLPLGQWRYLGEGEVF